MNQSTDGTDIKGAADSNQLKKSNLRLVKDEAHAVESDRSLSSTRLSIKPDQRLQNRVDELERQVELLQQQLEVERRLAQIDPLTAIPNRRAFAARLKSEVARSERNGSPLSLAVWDIDHFKMINDNYGHPFGDDVIRCVAQVIQSHLRESDFTARYGGEEFVALLPDCDAEGARILAEKICQVIRQSGCCLDALEFNLTASCGIATLYGADRDETLFKRADDALYRAKLSGRNRVVAEND
ncbi:MAG: GGDEF domain-containing protein [Candidatus Thiodiazotropha sp.]